MKRKFFIFLWTFLAGIGWPAILFLSFLAFVKYGGLNARSALRSIPEWLFWYGVMYGLFGVGSLAVATLAAVLSLRGKLPGTRNPADHGPIRSGFPVKLKIEKSVPEQSLNE